MKIRYKIYALSLSLLVFPLMGYYYVRQTEHYLQTVTNQELQADACEAARMLAQRPALFFSHAEMKKVDSVSRSFLDMMDSYNTVQTLSLVNPYLTHDKPIERWRDAYKNDFTQFKEPFYVDEGVSKNNHDMYFDYIAVKDNTFFYAIFYIYDDNFILPKPKDAEPINSDNKTFFIGDHIQVITKDPYSHLFKRHIVTLADNHSIIPYEVPLLGADINYPILKDSYFLISGHWEKTEYGYAVKLRIPLNYFKNRITLAVADADAEDGPVKTLISTTKPDIPLTKGETLLQAINVFGRHTRRALVLNNKNQVIDKLGEIKFDLEDSLTHRVLRLILGQYGYPPLEKVESGDFLDPRSRQEVFNSQQATQMPDFAAAQTSTQDVDFVSRYRGDLPHQAIHAVACPLFAESQTIEQTQLGTVIMEKAEPMALTSNRADMLKMLGVTLSAYILVALALWRVASSLSYRLNRLRREVEQGLGTAGNVQPNRIYKEGNDELAELARSFAALLGNLSEHYRYLQDMAGRLAHELRTPITVVRLSLENLSHATNDTEREEYLQRANNGLKRLHTLIQRLTEGSRLEQTMQQAEREQVNLVEFLQACTESYRMIYPHNQFVLQVPETPVFLYCSPDLLAQMLDKLVNNAVDFAKPDTPIELRLYKETKRRRARLEVGNQGKPLPKELRKRIFDSMVSLRDKTGKTTEPHLGLGLYIVRIIIDFHHGSISALEHPLGGALFRIYLPFSRSELAGPTVEDN
jgi:signal transduction histidine kinase